MCNRLIFYNAWAAKEEEKKKDASNTLCDGMMIVIIAVRQTYIVECKFTGGRIGWDWCRHDVECSVIVTQLSFSFRNCISDPSRRWLLLTSCNTTRWIKCEVRLAGRSVEKKCHLFIACSSVLALKIWHLFQNWTKVHWTRFSTDHKLFFQILLGVQRVKNMT